MKPLLSAFDRGWQPTVVVPMHRSSFRNGPGLCIQPATPADIPCISHFNLLMAKEMGLVLDPQRMVHGVRAVVADPTLGTYFIARLGSEPVGQLQVTPLWNDWLAGYVWLADGFYVTPEARRRGIGLSLGRHIVAVADTDPKVVAIRLELLTATQRDPRLRTFYERLGFRKTGIAMERTSPLFPANQVRTEGVR